MQCNEFDSINFFRGGMVQDEAREVPAGADLADKVDEMKETGAKFKMEVVDKLKKNPSTILEDAGKRLDEKVEEMKKNAKEELEEIKEKVAEKVDEIKEKAAKDDGSASKKDDTD